MKLKSHMPHQSLFLIAQYLINEFKLYFIVKYEWSLMVNTQWHTHTHTVFQSAQLSDGDSFVLMKEKSLDDTKVRVSGNVTSGVRF